jgi:hypothetical protein
MKARLILWTMMTVAVAAMVIVVWFHRSALSPAKSEAQNPSTSTVAPPVAKTFPANVTSASQSTVSASQTQKQPHTLAQIVANGQADYRQRKEAIQKLAAGKLSDADRETLYNFLREHSAADDGQLGQVLKNQLLDVLCAMQPPPQGLGELLAQIYQDQSQDVVLRDYAVQHMVAYYQQMSAATGVADQTRSDELKLMQQTLWAALNNTGSSIAGTALLGLNRLSQEDYPGFDQNKIADKALDLASQNDEELTRITAIQVCASLNVRLALPIVLGAAQAGETASVEISAIGALGSLGGNDQIQFLNSVLQGKDDRLKVPAQQALNQIQQRMRSQAQKAG